MIKIGIHGINGKMGLAIAKLLIDNQEFELASGSVRMGHGWVDKKLNEVSEIASNVRITSSLDNLCRLADVVVDFSNPQASLKLLSVCEKLGKPLLIGTTGFSKEGQNWLQNSANNLPLLVAENTSIGVNVLLMACKLVAKQLNCADWDVEILEMHHNKKIDAPSGTALKIGKVIADAQDTDFDQRFCYPHNHQRFDNAIGFASLRAGNVAGEHTAFFVNQLERLELSHKVFDRKVFAKGALLAAKWLVGQPKGFYSMEQVLGFV